MVILTIHMVLHFILVLTSSIDLTYSKTTSNQNLELVGENNQQFRCPFACLCNATYHVACVSDFYDKVPPLPILTRSALILGIRDVQMDAFSSCPDINIIHLSKTVKSLSESAFTGLSKLSVLLLKFTEIDELPNDIFREARNLSELVLNGNKLRVIPNEPLCQTPLLKSIRLDSNKITRLGFGRCFLLLRELSSLTMNQNNIHRIGENDLQNLSNSPLKVMRLSQCKISYISAGAFKYINQIEILDISMNNLHSVQHDILVNLQNLLELDVSLNKLYDLYFLDVRIKTLIDVKLSLSCDHFPCLNLSILSPVRKFPLENLKLKKLSRFCHRNVTSDALKGFPNLRVIDLTDVSLNQWSLDNVLIGLVDSKRSLQNLKMNLNVKSLHEKSFSESKLENLTSLYFSGLIPEVRNNTFHVFSNLIELSFHRCRLQFIAAGAFLGVRSLHYLNLPGNFLTILPIFNLPQLKRLDLTNNKLSDLRWSPFHKLHNLEVLFLSGNGLTEKDIHATTFSGLLKLKTLDLGRNQLKRLFRKKSPLRGLKSLKTLKLLENGITGFRNGSFHDLTNLTSLDIGRNNLWYTEREMRFVFQRLFNLEELALESCGLAIIPTHLFTNLTSLKRLYLGRNSISSLEPGAFESLQKLEMLNLDINRISSLNRSSFEGLHSLRSVDLSSNPFDCTCSLLWFKNWIATTNVNLHFTYFEHFLKVPIYACATPPDKAGMSLFDFNISEKDCVDNMILTVIKIAIGVFVPAILIICAVIRYRWYLRYYCFLVRSRTKRYASLQNESRMFDAFVCYHSDDLRWVINNLLPNLEYEHGFKLCLHDQNWLPGIDIAENIVQSIEMSRKTILVVTNKFAQSRWCQLEASLAQHAHLSDGRDVIVMLLLETIQPENMNSRLYSIIQSKTYIEWTDNEKGRQLFWKRLRLALMKSDHRGNIELIATETTG